MKTKSPAFSTLSLLSFGIIGLFMVVFYLFSEVKDPEYLIYFAPILGLLFYGSYYIINHKLDMTFLQDYNREAND